MRPDTTTYNSLLFACNELEDWILALELLRKFQVPKDLVTYNTLIRVYATCSEWPGALAVQTTPRHAVEAKGSVPAAESQEPRLEELVVGIPGLRECGAVATCPVVGAGVGGTGCGAVAPWLPMEDV